MGKSFSELENNSSKRLIGIGAVILLHLILAYILISGLSKDIQKPVDRPVELQIIQDKKPEPEKPKPIEKPPEPPKIVKKVLKTTDTQKVVQKTTSSKQKTETAKSTTKQETTTTQEKTTQNTTTSSTQTSSSQTTSTTKSSDQKSDEPKEKPAGVTRGVSKGEAGCKPPDYPREAQMSEEQGTVLISVLVDGTGKVKEAKVKRSSGSKTLDKAASKAFSLCTFKPAMKDGEPQESWYDIPYEFAIQ